MATSLGPIPPRQRQVNMHTHMPTVLNVLQCRHGRADQSIRRYCKHISIFDCISYLEQRMRHIDSNSNQIGRLTLWWLLRLQITMGIPFTSPASLESSLIILIVPHDTGRQVTHDQIASMLYSTVPWINHIILNVSDCSPSYEKKNWSWYSLMPICVCAKVTEDGKKVNYAS